MKKIGILVLTLFFLGACSNNNSNDEKVEYKTKNLSSENVDEIKIGDNLDDIYEKLGKPLKEWDDDFVYKELESAVLRDELIVGMSGMEDLKGKHEELAKKGKEAKEINKMTMLQYTYKGDVEEATALFWISPKTEKLVYFNQRALLDENGEQVSYGNSSDNENNGNESAIDSYSKQAIGDKVPFKDNGDVSVDVQIQSVSKDDGNNINVPEGVFFAKVTFLISNTSNVPFDFNSHFLEFYDSADIKSELSSRDFFSESIQPGKSAQGIAYFDVKNEGDNFEVFFADTAWQGTYQ